MNQRDRQRMYDDRDIPGARQERDLVVAPNEFAYVSDQTKGNINVHTGPMKSSLAGTDQLVNFNYKTKRFESADMTNAKHCFATAPEGWYLVLKNPAVDGNQPMAGRSDTLRDLTVGRKVNIPGPVSFALWPGQMVKTVKGHILRSNQYLVVRVYDEESARENWKKSVVKKVDGEDTNIDEVIGDIDLTMGRLFIIRGTEVSFYIPPTGVEVVEEKTGEYVRDAVTLERLEYCILKDENGKKRYMKGPDVVFPEPTEIFLRRNNSRKFKAIELSPISGLYIKVIADYDDYKIGDELFITGKDQMIYFPREEHAIMKYGDKEKHYATAIPAGEARYVLDRLDGTIRLEKGPSMFLPDPRKEVLVRRILNAKQVQTWFPGNVEALAYNNSLKSMADGENDYVTADMLASASTGRGVKFGAIRGTGYETKQVYDDNWDTEKAVSAKMADELQRKTTYTKPRTVTIDSKYEGAVVVDVWTGYAVKIRSKTNEHKVVVGPATIVLEYDQSLEHMELSTKTPKSDDNLISTVYLRVLNNKVSDIITAETADNCRVDVKLSYRVNFEGDKSKWFDVENYVKFMCDHMRSFAKALIKKFGIEEFYANPHDILRDSFLGEAVDGERPGRMFHENGMRIYEVEILGVKIGDKEIERMLIQNQNDLVRENLQIARFKRQVKIEKEKQELNRENAQAQLETQLAKLKNSELEDTERGKLEQMQKDLEFQLEEKKKEVEMARQDILDETVKAELARKKAKEDQNLEVAREELKMIVEKIQAEVEAVKEKGQALTPQLVKAIQTAAEMDFAGKLSDNMSIRSMLGGENVVDLFEKMIGGDVMGKISSLMRRKEAERDHDRDDW